MKKLNKVLVVACLAFASVQAFAEQRVPADERVPQKVFISKKSLSRISIDGSRIKNAKYLDGELEIDKEASSGQIFVRALTNKTISLFVNSESGKTYLLLLTPTAKDGETIIIDEKIRERAAEERLLRTPPAPQPVTTKSSEYIRSIKQMMVAMMTGTQGSMGLQMRPAYQTISLWKNTLFVQTAQYTAADMMAEKFTLTNTGSAAIVVREQEFYRKNVYAVSVMKHNLEPGESTQVYIVHKLGGGA